MPLIDDEMFEKRNADTEELLCEGEYESDKNIILKGYKAFQKTYVLKNTIIQAVIYFLAFVIQVVTILAAAKSPEPVDTSFFKLLMIVCVAMFIYVTGRPGKAYKDLEKSLDEIKGAVYKGEIYTNKIVITTVYDPYYENTENNEEPPPSTDIHLDNPAVEIIDREDMYVVYVKQSNAMVKQVNVFVIPKSAFSDEEREDVKNRLSVLLGIRYKIQQ